MEVTITSGLDLARDDYGRGEPPRELSPAEIKHYMDARSGKAAADDRFLRERALKMALELRNTGERIEDTIARARVLEDYIFGVAVPKTTEPAEEQGA